MNSKKAFAVTLAALTGTLQCVTAWPDQGHRASTGSSHAPLGVMGDHMHGKGEFMASYRFMSMEMDGNRIGSARVSARDIVGSGGNPGRFLVAPTSMPMEMHMLGLMYGLSDNITLMGMLNFVSNEMDHLIRNGRTFTTESSGLGDTRLSAMVRLPGGSDGHKWHLNLGVSLPTGSTDERDDTPAMADAFLPYPMQMGSGTFDLMPGVTYNGRQDNWTWGGQGTAVIRTGDADEGYTLGDRFGLSAWVALDLNARLSVSARLDFQDWGNIDGANPALNPRMVQTADTQLQGGQRTDLLIGANYLFSNGHRLAIEYGEAISQNLDGPQLETDSVLIVGWQKAF